jgi:hypothetical protein
MFFMFVKLRLVEVLLGENNTSFHKIQNLGRYQFIDIVHAVRCDECLAQ